VIELFARFWRTRRGRWQWYVLWLFHAKFVLGVSGVILDDRDHVLLLRHRYWKSGSWGLPGGYASRGERLEETLAREVREETGYTIQTLALLRIVSGYRLRLEASFLARIQGGEPRLDPHEVLEARFFPPDALPTGLLASHRELVALALARPPDSAPIMTQPVRRPLPSKRPAV
jgi:ADP-ribose pyrophosphatase YjhB (NUDIX family)